MLHKLLQNLNQYTLLKNQFANINKIFATMIDFFLILPLRVFIVIIYIQPKMVVFWQDFAARFGSEIKEMTPEYFQFFSQHSIVWQLLIAIIIFIVIGAVYNIYFHSSNWQATIGKRILKIIITTNNNQKITIFHSFKYYVINNLGIIYIIFLIFYLQKYEINIYQAITSNIFFLAGIIFFVSSFYYSIFSKRKLSFLDLLANVSFESGRTNFKFPWSNT